MKSLKILPIFFCFTSFILNAQSPIVVLYDDGGNQIIREIYCEPTCPNNLLINPSFEDDQSVGWEWVVNGSRSVDSYTGSYCMKFCTPKDGGTGQKVLATAGLTYNLTAFAKKTGTPNCEVGMQFLNASGQQIGVQTKKQVTSEHYEQYSLTATAPLGTYQIQVWFWKSLDACAAVDDWCLTSDAVIIPSFECAGGLLIDPDFSFATMSSEWWRSDGCFTQGGILTTCEIDGGAGQNILATPGDVYTLKVKAKVSQHGFNGMVAMRFLNAEGVGIGNPMRQLVYSTKFQAYTLVGVAPDNAQFVQVWFWKSEGTGCMMADEWCLTSSSNALEERVRRSDFMAYRIEQAANLIWFDNMSGLVERYEVERIDKQGVFVQIGEVANVGFSTRLEDFQYVDTSPGKSVNRYRIKSVLKNGLHLYSQIREVEFPLEPATIVPEPNPAGNWTYVRMSERISECPGALLILVDGIGHELRRIHLKHEDLQTPYYLLLDNLKSGYYFIWFESDGMRRISAPLVIIKD